ncbi:MAG: DUF1573 domain-containing protein [Crocinitomix sp.]|nr:DUF1573 domain-containing protein [Crocinitomix sp.]
MKKAVLTLSLLLVAMFNFAQEGQPVAVGAEDGPVMQIDKDIHDYGTLEYEGNGTCVFTITNLGNAPLIISLCKGSCGCTVPSCPEQPIAPGTSAEITVKFDTTRPGPFHKSVTITSNAVNTPSKVVKIKGSVKAKPVADTIPPTN